MISSNFCSAFEALFDDSTLILGLFSRTRYVAFVRHAAYQFQQLQQQSQKKADENKVCTVCVCNQLDSFRSLYAIEVLSLML